MITYQAIKNKYSAAQTVLLSYSFNDEVKFRLVVLFNIMKLIYAFFVGFIAFQMIYANTSGIDVI